MFTRLSILIIYKSHKTYSRIHYAFAIYIYICVCVCVCVCISTFGSRFAFIIFTIPSARAGYDTRSTFKRSLIGFNSEYSFSSASCLTKTEEPSLSYYLSIAGGRLIGFIPFPSVLVLCEMQSVSCRIWTRVAVSNSYDDNHCTTRFAFIVNVTRHNIISYNQRFCYLISLS